MNNIKSFFTNDTSARPISIKKQSSQQMPYIIGLDHCNRFRPLFDQKTFKTQFQDTNGEIVDYLEYNTREQYRSFMKNGQIITTCFWITNFSFAAFCHKIPFISKLLGQKTWKMFIFKLASLSGSYFLIENVMNQAQEQQIQLLFQKSKKPYRYFKLSGDITQLNPFIELIGQPLAFQDEQTPGKQQ